MKTLQELAAWYGTDKLGKGYIEHYAKHFEPLRNLPLRVLEMGVWNGSSIQMWRDFFPKATIFGIDIKRQCIEADYGHRVHLFQIDQGNPDELNEFAYKTAGPFDLVIDDAGHHMAPQQIAFRVLFDHVVRGGVYVIEDMVTSYRDEFEGGYLREGTTAEMLKACVDDLLSGGFVADELIQGEHRGKIASIHFCPKIVFLFKK